MSEGNQETVDLLEVFYARSVKNNILRELARLRDDCNFLPEFDAQHRFEIMAYYERMLLACTHLLHRLGDATTLDEGSPDLNPGA